MRTEADLPTAGSKASSFPTQFAEATRIYPSRNGDPFSMKVSNTAGVWAGNRIHSTVCRARPPDAEAIALVFEEKTLTYRELDHRANELAGRCAIRRWPRGPGAVSMTRSLEW